MRILTVGSTGVVAMQRALDWMAARGERVWISDYDNQYAEPLPDAFRFQPFMPIRRLGGSCGVFNWVQWPNRSRRREFAGWPIRRNRRWCMCTASTSTGCPEKQTDSRWPCNRCGQHEDNTPRRAVVETTITCPEW
jgi:hypothetical protein